MTNKEAAYMFEDINLEKIEKEIQDQLDKNSEKYKVSKIESKLISNTIPDSLEVSHIPFIQIYFELK